MSQYIDVSKFNGKIKEYNKEFIYFCNKNKIKIPNIDTLKGQIIGLLTNSENYNKYITRDGLNIFIDSIGMYSSDIIQAVNKTSQWGLVSETLERQYYRIPYPFRYIDLHLKKRTKTFIGLNRDDKINTIKEYLIENYINIPNNKWQEGHKDPSMPLDDNNLVLQPPIQGRFRDKYKFDDLGITKYPTINELNHNFEKYYTISEIKYLYDIIKKRLNS